MKKCKILLFWNDFRVPIGKHEVKNKYNLNVFDYPEAEAILEEYLNAGWVVKNMCSFNADTAYGKYDYTFYLERDI